MKPRTIIGLVFIVASLTKLATIWGIIEWSRFARVSEEPWVTYFCIGMLIYVGVSLIIDCLVAQKSLLKDNSLTLRAAVLDCFQRNRMNEFSDCGYNQIQQNNRFSTHKLMLSLIYRLNATRSKYKGTGAGKDAQARMGS